jgi:hypothetical protein
MSDLDSAHSRNDEFYLNPDEKGTRVDPEDILIGLDGEQHTVLDFWRWSFSDLCDDALKGQFTEWLVTLLLGIPCKRHLHWENTDFETETGVRIEVKSSSYWQSWKLWGNGGKPRPVRVSGKMEELRISFAGLKVRDNTQGSLPEFRSDLYIFAFQAQRDPRLWNALDLGQWEFYMLTKAEMKSIGSGKISLSTVRSKAGAPMTASELRIRGHEKIAEIAEHRNAASAAAAGG